MSHKPQVLIVEDSLLTALEMQLALEEAGYRVLGPAASYERAMGLVDAFQLDIVLLDIELSGPKNGVAVARELLKRHIPALFVSAITPNDPEARKSAVGILSKPIDAERLIDSVEAVQEISAGKTPSSLPSGFERYDWRPVRIGEIA